MTYTPAPPEIPGYAYPSPPQPPTPHRDRPPFYRRAWFIGLIGLLVGAIIAGTAAASANKTKVRNVAGPTVHVTATTTATETQTNVVTETKTVSAKPSAAPTHQPGNDQAYVATLKANPSGYFDNVDSASLISLGHSVCSALDRGASETELAAPVEDIGGTAADAGWLIGAAESAYCPEYK